MKCLLMAMTKEKQSESHKSGKAAVRDVRPMNQDSNNNKQAAAL